MQRVSLRDPNMFKNIAMAIDPEIERSVLNTYNQEDDLVDTGPRHRPTVRLAPRGEKQRTTNKQVFVDQLHPRGASERLVINEAPLRCPDSFPSRTARKVEI